jgi:hypothetical protein
MNKPGLIFLSILMLVIFLRPALSQPRYTKTVEAEFEDVFFDLQEAIINTGLGIEHIGHVGKMLDRTAIAVTGTDDKSEQTYKFAKYLQFCSAKLTYKATSQNPANLSFCPFVLYAYETVKDPGRVTVGYRNPDIGDLSQSDPLSIEIHGLLKQLVDTTVADY